MDENNHRIRVMSDEIKELNERIFNKIANK